MDNFLRHGPFTSGVPYAHIERLLRRANRCLGPDGGYSLTYSNRTMEIAEPHVRFVLFNIGFDFRGTRIADKRWRRGPRILFRTIVPPAGGRTGARALKTARRKYEARAPQSVVSVTRGRL